MRWISTLYTIPKEENAPIAECKGAFVVVRLSTENYAVFTEPVSVDESVDRRFSPALL